MSRAFQDFLIKRCEQYDAKILKDFRMDSVWIGSVEAGSWNPFWWEVRERVRMISEGIAFKPSPGSIESDHDIFTSVFPDLNQGWKPIKPGTVLDVILK